MGARPRPPIRRRKPCRPRNIRRVLDKDVLPAIGDKPVAEVTIPDILAITDAVKARGADQMALQTRNVIKRLYAYAIARGKTSSTRPPRSRRGSSPPRGAATSRSCKPRGKKSPCNHHPRFCPVWPPDAASSLMPRNRYVEN